MNAGRKTMRWNDYTEIAEELNKHHPGEDLVKISDKRVEALVNALPAFSEKGTPPPPDILSAIITVWIQIKEQEEPDNSRWDAYS